MMSKNGIRRHNPLEKTRTRVFDRLHARDPCVKLAVQSELFFKFIPTVSCDSELSIKKTCEHTTDFVIIRKILMTTRICFHFLSRSRWMHQGGEKNMDSIHNNTLTKVHVWHCVLCIYYMSVETFIRADDRIAIHNLILCQ